MTWPRSIVVLALAVTCLGTAGPVMSGPPAGEPAPQAAPDPVERYLHRGLSLARKGEWSAAIAAFNETLEIDPTSGEALLLRGRAEAANKDFDAALRSFAAALSFLPHDASLYQAIGEVHLARGETGRATDAFAIAAHLFLQQDNRGDAAAAIARVRAIQADAPQLKELDARMATLE